MTVAEEGLYCRLINRLYSSRDGQFAVEDGPTFAGINPRTWRRLWPRIAEKFDVNSSGIAVQLRVNSERIKAELRLNSSRNNGANGGRPRTCDNREVPKPNPKGLRVSYLLPRIPFRGFTPTQQLVSRSPRAGTLRRRFFAFLGRVPRQGRQASSRRGIRSSDQTWDDRAAHSRRPALHRHQAARPSLVQPRNLAQPRSLAR